MRMARKDPRADLLPRAAWSKGFDQFVGGAFVAATFAIEGRFEEAFLPIWEAPLHDRPFWESKGGYVVRAVHPEALPVPTMALLDPRGDRCGFCSGGQLWIDTAHRGRGLGPELVLAMTVALGRGPTADRPEVGFSEAGIVANRRAWCLAVERASDEGLNVDVWNVQAAQIYRAADAARAAEADGPRPAGATMGL